LETNLLVISLFAILAVVLVAPLTSKRIENNLEIFFLAMGLLAATLSGVWTLHLVKEALTTPIPITSAVVAAGLAFHMTRTRMRRWTRRVLEKIRPELFALLAVAVLGLSSSVISVIIASLILVEIASLLPISHHGRVNFTVMACFALGLGASLTPIGEPLSTIVLAKLNEPPYNAGFFYLVGLLALYVVPAVLIFAGLSSLFVRQNLDHSSQTVVRESLREVVTRALKVYVFIAALILLGSGFQLLIELYFAKTPPALLYWLNIISAVLDNATLAAAEIGPVLTEVQIRSALIALLVAGGMLIPGNIPNIIAANKLHIKSREWARVGVPVGFVGMAAYYVILFYR